MTLCRSADAKNGPECLRPNVRPEAPHDQFDLLPELLGYSGSSSPRVRSQFAGKTPRQARRKELGPMDAEPDSSNAPFYKLPLRLDSKALVVAQIQML